MKKSALLIAFCVLAFVSCKKNPVTEPLKNVSRGTRRVSHYPIDATTRSYSYFKPGTYWIYKDSLSGYTDSVYVTHLDQGTSIQDSYNDTCDWFDVSTRSSFSGEKHIISVHRQAFYTIAISSHAFDTSGIDPQISVIDYKDSVYSTISSNYLNFPYVIETYNPCSVYLVENNVTLFTLNSVVIQDVLQIYNKPGTLRFLAPKYGLLRKVVNMSNPYAVWNLIRCHIIQ